jgi:hypothetical protein
VVEEVEAELVAAADAVQAGVGGGVGAVEDVGAQVGQFGVLQVAPGQFHGVEVVGEPGSASTVSQCCWVASQAFMALERCADSRPRSARRVCRAGAGAAV